MQERSGLIKTAEKPRVDLGLQLETEYPEIWRPDYAQYNEDTMYEKLKRLETILRERDGGESNDWETVFQEIEITRAFIGRCFREFQADRFDTSERPPASFAFVVPPRVQKQVRGESDEYMAEWLGFCPVLRHFDSHVAQRFLAGLPPFIVDQYKGANSEGRVGYMLFVPLFTDMRSELDLDSFYRAGAAVMSDCFDMARKLDVHTVALGATLPGFILQCDKRQDQLEAQGITLRDQDIELTTGHAMTVYLMGRLVQEITEKGHLGLNGDIAVIGAGKIGSAFIAHLRENIEYEGKITIFDTSTIQIERVKKVGHDNIHVADSLKQLILGHKTVVCAATGRLSLSKTGIKPNQLEGVVFIDDSQPGCFTFSDVAEAGGKLLWVIGSNPDDDTLTHTTFGYNGLGPVEGAWGCLMEGQVVDKFRSDGLGNLAIRRVVTARDAAVMGAAAEQSGLGLAPLQAAGQPVDIP